MAQKGERMIGSDAMRLDGIGRLSPARVVLALLLVFHEASIARADDEIPSPISADALLSRIEAGTAPTIVDVRSRSEFEAGHVPGAIHIPFWAALSRASEIPSGSDEPIVIYCEHGPRAYLARSGFWIAGYSEVILLKGHMTGWKKLGLPQQSTPPDDRDSATDRS